jgi:tetratricopeptide (TPR) repeat protein
MTSLRAIRRSSSERHWLAWHANEYGAELARAGEWEAASDVFDLAIDIAGAMPVLLHNRGIVRFMCGEVALADGDIADAIALGADGTLVWANRASLLLARRRYGQAADAFTKALTRADACDSEMLVPEALAERGVALASMGEIAAALADIEEAERQAVRPELRVESQQLRALLWGGQ